MGDTPAFQGHHVIEQQAQNNSALLRELIEKGYFDLDGPRNMLNLPAKQSLAARMDLSPHPGGPLGGYSKGLQGVLAELELSRDGQLTLAGDDAACKRMAERVNTLSDTVKAGLINEDVVCNRPLGTTRKLANEGIGRFFERIDDYALEHRTQIAALREMPATEARWAAVTQSERNVLEAIDAMQGKHAKAVAGNADAGRRSLGQAIAEAEDGSGLALSDKTRQRLADVFPESHGPEAVRVRGEVRASKAAAEAAPERMPANPEAEPGARKPGSASPDGAPATPETPPAPKTGPAAPRTGPGAVETGPVAPQPMRPPGAPQGVPLVEPEGPAAGPGRGARIAGAAGMAMLAYDVATTGHQMLELRAQGNDIGADSVGTHFIARNGGGLVGGAVAGAGYGLWAGSWTGPGAFVVGLAGGVGGAIGGEAIAAKLDHDRIYKQTDPNGVRWEREAHTPYWFRADSAWDFEGQVTGRHITGKIGETNPLLDYQSANAAYALGLASPQAPVDPYSLSAGEVSGFQTSRWTRAPDAGTWTRTLVEQTYHRDMMPGSIQTQTADGKQAAALDAQSQLIVAQNALNTPAASAARYLLAYEYFDWSRFGPVPDAVRHAAGRTDTLQGSDGGTYVRGADGGWRDGDTPAAGNVRAELDATWQSQQAGLRDMAASTREATVNSAALRDEVYQACYTAGLNPADETTEAMATAVARTQLRTGVDPAQTTLRLDADGSIATLAGSNGKGVVIVRTGADEIEASLHEHGLPPVAPVPAPPAPAPEAPAPGGFRTEYRLDPYPDGSTRAPPPGTGSDGLQHGSAPLTDARVAQATPVRAPMLDDPRHPDHVMYDALSRVVEARDAALGREPDQTSRQLAAGLVADARGAGLQSIGFAQFSPDGSRVYMTDTRDPSSPLARTAIGDVAQAVERPLEESQAHVERIGATERQQTARLLAQDVSQHESTQSAPTQAAPRMS